MTSIEGIIHGILLSYVLTNEGVICVIQFSHFLFGIINEIGLITTLYAEISSALNHDFFFISIKSCPDFHHILMHR